MSELKTPFGRDKSGPAMSRTGIRVTVRLPLVVGTIAALYWSAGCRSKDELAPYDFAVEIRRDAKVLLTTRPSGFELITADAGGR